MLLSSFDFLWMYGSSNIECAHSCSTSEVYVYSTMYEEDLAMYVWTEDRFKSLSKWKLEIRKGPYFSLFCFEIQYYGGTRMIEKWGLNCMTSWRH